MKKILAFLVMFSLLSVAGVLGGSTDDTGVGGTLSDVVEISVTPENIDFGAIPQGTDVTVDVLEDIIIDTSGSDTATDNVYVYVGVNGADADFYNALLEFGEGEPTTWTDIIDVGEIVIPEGDLKTYSVRLQGDTQQFDAGEKTAVITYSAYGTSQK